MKRFDVRAIDVDIPLNRFGDHDPLGKMYVLADQVDAVRAQERSRKVQIGLRDDPIQPLVIRANLGDCVEITIRNDATGGDYGMHIDGLSFAAGSSGDAIGDNTSSAVPQRRHAHVPLLRAARTSSSRAPTTCAPGRATARPSHTASSARWPSSRRARRTST